MSDHPDIETLVTCLSPDLFVVYEGNSGWWWGPNRGGYTDLLRAGVYSRAEAEDIQRFSDTYGRRDKMVPLAQAWADVYGTPRDGSVQAALCAAWRAEKARADEAQANYDTALEAWNAEINARRAAERTGYQARPEGVSDEL